MIGLIAFGSIGLWLVLSVWAAWRVSKGAKPTWLKACLFVVIAPALFVTPVADELIGKYQYKRYCKEAEEVKIYGTIPVGEELYTADGKWKLTDMSLPFQERNRLQAVMNSIIRWDLGPSLGAPAPAIIPIQYWDTKIYETKSGRLLVEFRQYASRGGWLSRVVSERAMLVPAQCLPPLFDALNQTILPFNGSPGGTKQETKGVRDEIFLHAKPML